MSRTLTIPTAEVFTPLLDNDLRYLGAYGGRGSGKSRFFSGKMVEDHQYFKGRRSVCVREVQKSLKGSSKLILEDTLKRFRLGEAQGFKIFNEVIQTPGDGIIVFQGMNGQNDESLKSLEDFDCAWVEEAQTLSATSLRVLRPTIRKAASQIWFSWNPRRKIDPVDMFLRGKELPSKAAVVKANWRDNPFWTAELEQERLDDLRLYPDQYPHVWEGEYVSVVSGAYLAKQLNRMREENRICRVNKDPLMTFRAFWDIGGTGAKADACSITVAQFVGREIRVVDYYEAVGQELSVHVNWMLEHGYRQHNSKLYLPHDGINHDRVFDVTYESELRRAGFSVQVIPNQGTGAAMQRVEALRRISDSLWIDEERCEGLIDCLGWHHEKIDEKRGIGLGPEHDWSSHGFDSAGLMAVIAEEVFAEQNRRKPRQKALSTGGGWMG